MRTRLGVILLAMGIPLLFSPFWQGSTPLSVHAPLALTDPWFLAEQMEERAEFFVFPADFYVETRGDRLAPARTMMLAVVGEVPDAMPLATQRGRLWFKSNIFRATLTREQYLELARKPEVIGIGKVPEFVLTKDYPAEPVERVAETVGLSELYARGYNGYGTIIAIIDGFAPDFEEHLALGFRPEWADRVLEYHGASTDSKWKDHGVMTSSIAASLAPQAKLVLIDVHKTDPDPFFLLRELLEKYPEYQIISSNSWVFEYNDEAYHDRTREVNRFFVELTERGIVVCFAAGNFGKPGDHPEGICDYSKDRDDWPIEIGYPAALERVLSVAAVDALGERALHFSSVGPAVNDAPEPDITAPGMFLLPESPFNGWASGTSAACPVAAAAIACALTNAKVRDVSLFVSLVQRSAEDMGPAGFDYEFGWGLVDALTLRTFAPSPVAPAPPPPMSILGGGMIAAGALLIFLPIKRVAS